MTAVPDLRADTYEGHEAKIAATPLDSLIAWHMAAQGAIGSGDEGEVPHDGYMVCGCRVSREIARRLRAGLA